MEFKYLHIVGEHVSWLDHRIVPEVRAMFAAMMSRVPKGGIAARYEEVVTAVAKEIVENYSSRYDFAIINENQKHAAVVEAEDALTQYPLVKTVQEFFDKFVGNYGHSSIMELTGSPTIFIEGISWWMAYLTFDSPLVKGQEMSTRAVWRRDWKMAGDAMSAAPVDFKTSGLHTRISPLQELHELGLEIAWHETEAWKAERLERCPECSGNGWIGNCECETCEHTGQKHPSYDPQSAFRFAFDKARWALPGSIETGVAHTADIRTMARVIKVMEGLATTTTPALDIIAEIKEAYRQALPGMSGMGLKEAVYDTSLQPAIQVPGNVLFDTHQKPFADDSRDVLLTITKCKGDRDLKLNNPSNRNERKSYVDPWFNHYAQVNIDIRCSLAASRDWHRHRTFYPWTIRVVRENPDQLGEGHRALLLKDMTIQEDGLAVWGDVIASKNLDGSITGTEIKRNLIQIDHHYEPISEFGKANTERYLRLATALFDKYMEDGNQWLAMLCLPLGTRVLMSAQGGLRDALYMLELRGYVAGGNFEYQEQARTALNKLVRDLGYSTQDKDSLFRMLGLDQEIF